MDGTCPGGIAPNDRPGARRWWDAASRPDAVAANRSVGASITELLPYTFRPEQFDATLRTHLERAGTDVDTAKTPATSLRWTADRAEVRPFDTFGLYGVDGHDVGVRIASPANGIASFTVRDASPKRNLPDGTRNAVAAAASAAFRDLGVTRGSVFGANVS